MHEKVIENEFGSFLQEFAKHSKSVIKSYDLVETDTELFITGRVNNLLFRKNGLMEGMSYVG